MHNQTPTMTPPPPAFAPNWEDSLYCIPSDDGQVDIGQHYFEPVNGHPQNEHQTPVVSPSQPIKPPLLNIKELAKQAIVVPLSSEQKGEEQKEDGDDQPPERVYIHHNRHTPHWWLDEYIEYSRKHSPRAFAALHEACGLWLLSGMVGGRTVIHFGGRLRHTSLMIAVVGRSSVWAKSHTIGIAERLLSEAELKYRTLPSKATPQAIIEDMADDKRVVEIRKQINATPEDDDDTISKLQYQLKMLEEELGLRWAHEGQRIWHISEFGSKIIAGMMRPGSPMASFSDFLRDVNDKAGESYTYRTRGHGLETINNPYLAIIADTTPVDLQSFAKPNAPLWTNGFFPRFAILAPNKGEKPNYARVPYEMQYEDGAPASLVQPLIDTDQWLGRRDGYDAPLPRFRITYSPEIYEEFYGYEQHIQGSRLATEDLDGTYSRLFSEQCLSIAVLLAVVDSRTEILMSDVHRAIECCERVRECTDDFYLGMTENEVDEKDLKRARVEEKVLRIIGRLKKKKDYWPSASEIRMQMGPSKKRPSVKEMQDVLLFLQMEGAIKEFKYEDKSKRGKRYRLVV